MRYRKMPFLSGPNDAACRSGARRRRSAAAARPALALLALAALAAAAWLGPRPSAATFAAAVGDVRPPAAIAHRGASCCAPENTMAAFRRAAALGADYLEFDLQTSRDGRLVLMHDEQVNRTTNGRGRVRDLSFAELRALDAGSWYGRAYAGEPVPTLEEVLDAYAGKIGLLIDLKEPRLSPGIERRVAAALRARRLDGRDSRIVVQSFDTGSLKRMRALLPHIPIAVLHSKPGRLQTSDLLEYRAFADALHVRRKGVSAALVRRIHDCGLLVAVWDVRSSRSIARLAAAGVDAVICDDPDRVRRATG